MYIYAVFLKRVVDAEFVIVALLTDWQQERQHYAFAPF
jgi:hypothetical protein